MDDELNFCDKPQETDVTGNPIENTAIPDEETKDILTFWQTIIFQSIQFLTTFPPKITKVESFGADFVQVDQQQENFDSSKKQPIPDH